MKFEVQRVQPSPERPHGVQYSLTLHDSANRRLVGSITRTQLRHVRLGAGQSLDHRHRLGIAKPYRYRGATQLIDNFWEMVDQVLKERGAKP